MKLFGSEFPPSRRKKLEIPTLSSKEERWARTRINTDKSLDFDHVRQKLMELGLSQEDWDSHRLSDNEAAFLYYGGKEAMEKDYMTLAEKKKDLKVSVEEVEGHRSQRQAERNLGHERRAWEYAHRLGLMDVRSEMIAAERDYKAAITRAVNAGGDKEFGFAIENEIPDEVKERYENARRTWRDSLSQASGSGSLSEADVRAIRFMGIRDTSLRIGRIRNEAIEAGLNERNGKGYRKALAWVKKDVGRDLKTMAKVYSAATEMAGSVFVKGGARLLPEYALKELGPDATLEERAAHQKQVENRARAGRILGSAAIVSALVATTGGAAAAPIAVDFLFRATRGVFGMVAGIEAGKGAGILYDRMRKETREKIDTAGADLGTSFKNFARFKNGLTPSALDMHDEEQLFSGIAKHKEQARKFESAREKVQIGAAIVAGGAAAGVSGPVLNPQLLGYEAVQNAVAETSPEALAEPADVTRPTNVDLTPEQQSAAPAQPPAAAPNAPPAEPPAAPAETGTQPPAAPPAEPPPQPPAAPAETGTQPPAAPPAPEELSVAINERNEGANSLLVELRERIQEKYGSDLTNASPAERMILSTDVNELSERLGLSGTMLAPDGHNLGPASRLMHEGDSLAIDERGRLLLRDESTGDRQVLIFANGDVEPSEDVLRVHGGTDTMPADGGGAAEAARPAAEGAQRPAAPDAAPATGDTPAPRTATEAAPSETPAPNPETARVPGAIDEAGEGTDRAFRELQQSLTAEQRASDSGVMKLFREATDANAISRALGEEIYGANGLRTQPGDRFFFDSENNLIFDPIGDGEPQMVLENDESSPNGYKVHAEAFGERVTDAAAPATEEAPRPAAEEANQGTETRPRPQEGPTTPAAPVEPPPAAAPAQSIPEAAAEQQTSPPTSTQPGFGTLRDLTQGSTEASVPTAPFEQPFTIPESTPTPSGQGPFRTLGDIIGQQNPAETGTPAIPTPEPLSWAPGSPLPAERSLFSFASAEKDFFVNDTTPQEGESLAKQYVARNPDNRYYFDNSDYDWQGAKIARTGYAEMGPDGNVRVVAEARDADGNPLGSIDPRQLAERIA